MRIFSDTASDYIQTLALSISKDPASLQDWHCVHISYEKGAPAGLATMLKQWQETYKDLDCDIVLCSDSDILIVNSSLDLVKLYQIASDLMQGGNAAPAMGEATFYNMFHNWRAVRSLLLAKAGEPVVAISQPAGGGFGDVSSLRSVFNEAKQLRKARQPLHVMIVEDDPLTRRLVTGAFKESYALITAENAQEAIANYLLHAPDIVFLDIGLPDTSGFAVLQQIMASDPEAYVVMFSGSGYLDNVTSALTAGASGFIAKPFKKEKMKHYIEDSAMHHHKYA